MVQVSYCRMKKLPLIALVLFLLGCLGGHNIRKSDISRELTPDKPLTVMTFNIRVGAGRMVSGSGNPYELSTKKEKLDPIIAAIKSVDPDIVALQEVLANGQIYRIAKALDMNYSFAGHETSASRSWWGVGILSKFPILNSKRRIISAGKGNDKSIAIATLDINGQPVTFFSIHKDPDLTDGQSFRNILGVAKSIDTPIILAGDFNVLPHDWRMNDFLLPDFFDTAAAVETDAAVVTRDRGTFLGIGRIDYVLVDKKNFKILDAGIVSDEAYWNASDHLAYYARILPQ